MFGTAPAGAAKAARASVARMNKAGTRACMPRPVAAGRGKANGTLIEKRCRCALLLRELRVAASAARHAVLVPREEHPGAAFRAALSLPGDPVPFDREEHPFEARPALLLLRLCHHFASFFLCSAFFSSCFSSFFFVFFSSFAGPFSGFPSAFGASGFGAGAGFSAFGARAGFSGFGAPSFSLTSASASRFRTRRSEER